MHLVGFSLKESLGHICYGFNTSTRHVSGKLHLPGKSFGEAEELNSVGMLSHVH